MRPDTGISWESQAYCSHCGIWLPGQARANRSCATCLKESERQRGRNRTASAICVECGITFIYRNARRATPHQYCSRTCQGLGSRSDRICSVEDCDQPHSGRGYCADHYWRYRRQAGLGKTCTAPECDKPMHGRGLCVNHHAKKYCPQKSQAHQAYCRVCNRELSGPATRLRVCLDCRPKRKPKPKPPRLCEICDAICLRRRKRCEEHWVPSKLSKRQLGLPRKERDRDSYLRGHSPVCRKGHARRQTSGGNWTCSTCRKEWRKNKPEHRRNERSRRRARKNGGNLSDSLWRATLEFFNHSCFYCDGPYEEQEHVVPLCDGGRHDLCNVVPSCRSCNNQKGTQSLEEWKPFEAVLLRKRLTELHNLHAPSRLS